MSDKNDLYQRGLDLFGQGSFIEAAECHRRALELAPEDGDLWMALSMALFRAGRIDEALDTGKRAVELNPDEGLLHTNLSLFYARKGMTAEAEREAAAARELAEREPGERAGSSHGGRGGAPEGSSR